MALVIARDVSIVVFAYFTRVIQPEHNCKDSREVLEEVTELGT